MSTFQLKKGRFQRTTAGNRTNVLEPWHAVHGFFERAGDGHHHLVESGITPLSTAIRIRGNRGWKNGNRDGESKIRSNQRQCDDHENHDSRVNARTSSPTFRRWMTL